MNARSLQLNCAAKLCFIVGMGFITGCHRARDQCRISDFSIETNVLVNVDDLKARPEYYHGKVVRVGGYFCAYDSNSLRGEDLAGHNAVWVEHVAFTGETEIRGLNKSGFVEIIGLFDIQNGHIYDVLCFGAMKRVLRYRYLDPDEAIELGIRGVVFATNVSVHGQSNGKSQAGDGR